MRRAISWLSLLLSISSIESAKGASITIPPARTWIVSSRAELVKACGTTNRIFGCTSFAGEKLECACDRIDETWRIRASAQFIPFIYIYVRQLEGISHEREHIEDIRASVDTHLTDLQSRVFISETDCTASASSEVAAFSSRMNEWKRLSNVQRHPELKQGRR